MNTLNQKSTDTTEKSIKLVAVLSSSLSVAYTVLLAAAAARGVSGEGYGFGSVLAVGLAVCFEAAKYSFMWGGFDLAKNRSGAALKLAGSAMLTLSIVISIISIAASKEYIESTGENTEKAIVADNKAQAAQVLKNSATIKEYEKTLEDIGDKMDQNKRRVDALMEEKEQLVEMGYITRASSVEKQIISVSKDIDMLIEKRDEYLLKKSEEEQRVREDIALSGSVKTVGKSATVVLAIVLEIISLLSVATFSLLKNSTAVAQVIEHKEVEKLVNEAKKTNTYPRRKRKPKEVLVDSYSETTSNVAKAYCEDLEGILERLGSKKLTVKNVREELSCSQTKAHEIHKELKKIESEKISNNLLN